MKRTLAIAYALVFALLSPPSCNGDQPDGDSNTTVTINQQALTISGKSLNSVAFAVYKVAPSDLTTFDPNAAGVTCTAGGSAGNWTQSFTCLPRAGSPTYALSRGSAADGSNPFQIAGAASEFDINESLENGSNFVLAVGGATQDNTARCFGYSAPFTIAQAMKTNVALTLKCVVPGTNAGYANINTTTQLNSALSISGFETGPMTAAVSSSVKFAVTATTSIASFVNFHFSSSVSGSGGGWDTDGTGTVDNINDVFGASAALSGGSQLYFVCPSSITSGDVTVTVWNSATVQSTYNPANALTPPVVLDFGTLNCL